MRSITLLSAIILFSQCANPVGPTGGDKDTKAPTITKVNITEENHQKKIYIIFDENINTKGSLSISPITNKKTIELNKHRNTLWFYVPQNTNSITLNDVISDVNENNPGKYPFIILGKDSSKFIVKYQTLNNQKDKIKAYIKIDSNYYYGDYTTKGYVNFGGLKKQNQTMYLFNDLNNNDKYDHNEDYYIQTIKKENLLNYNDTINDTLNYLIYPNNYKEVKRSVNIKHGYTLYHQVPKYILKKELEKNTISIISHHDSLVIQNSDTTYFDQILTSNKNQFKIIQTKTDIGISQKINIVFGNFEKDTIIEYDINLNPFIKAIENKQIRFNNTSTQENRDGQISITDYRKQLIQPIESLLKSEKSKDSILKKVKYKLGKIIIKNKNNTYKNLKIKLQQDNQISDIYALNNSENQIVLITGNYKYFIWEDTNDNNHLDHTTEINITQDELISKGLVEYEKIIHYNKETAVNSKLDNIIIVE